MLITSGVHLIRFHRLEMFVIGYDAMPGRRLSCRGWASLHQLARKTPARSYRWLAGVATPCAAEPQRRPWDRWTPTLPRRYCERKERSETFENVLTIPNFLCLSRILMSPYIAHLIVQTGNYPWALAAFGYAGITDLVSVQNSLYWKLSVNCLFYLNSWTDGLLVTSRDKCQSLGVSWTLCRTRC